MLRGMHSGMQIRPTRTQILFFAEKCVKVLDGQIGVVGGGGRSGRRKSNILSILEIGEHQLKRIVLPDALREPMATGKQARILLGRS